jgi:hypothetical protein
MVLVEFLNIVRCLFRSFIHLLTIAGCGESPQDEGEGAADLGDCGPEIRPSAEPFSSEPRVGATPHARLAKYSWSWFNMFCR